MYPKVKVRAQAHEQEDFLSPQNDSKSELFSRATDSLSVQVAEKENQGSISPLPIARILKAYVLNSTMELNSASKVENKRLHVKASKSNLTASSVPRPRAILSSPDNDGMIGIRNKLINERSSTLKMHNKEEKVVAVRRTKLIIPIEEGKPERPLNMAKTSDKAFKSKSDQRQKQRKFQEPVMRSQKTILRVGKSSLV